MYETLNKSRSRQLAPKITKNLRSESEKLTYFTPIPIVCLIFTQPSSMPRLIFRRRSLLATINKNASMNITSRNIAMEFRL